jgi:glycosyltransferase involved in cell wall biosynthesis
MVDNKILTIAIPTYNRANYLKLCLNQIFNQIQPFRRFIQILISNNCSNDNTESVVFFFINQGYEIEYIKNNENIGANKNVYQCFRLAKTKYVLIFGDDDVILDNKLPLLINILLHNDVGIVNFRGFGYKNNYILEKPKNDNRMVYFYNNNNDFVRRINIELSFISGNIINKTLFDHKINPEVLKSTNLIQLSWVFSVLNNSKNNLFLDSFIIASKSDNTGGYQLCDVFGTKFNIISNYLIKKGISKNYFKIINQQNLICFFPYWIYKLRLEQSKSFIHEDFYNTLFPIFKKSILFWLVTFPIIKFPLKIARLVLYGINFFVFLERKFNIIK